MAYSINKVQLLGNVTQDINLRMSSGGLAICNFSIATNRSQKDNQTGEYKDIPEYHNLVCFGKTAELCERLLQKGSKLFVEGELRTSSWVKEGTEERRYKTEIVVNDLNKIVFLSNLKENAGSSTSNSSASVKTPKPSSNDSELITADDIPF